jgi:hypothetical protein
MPALRPRLWPVVLGIFLATGGAWPLLADKEGMPDLSQEDQTCLPTSTANVIVWFGNHGYPKLIQPEDSKDNGYIHTIHAIMRATDANYDFGTRTDAITYGIEKYVRNAGYGCDVEYRGLDWSQAKFPNLVKDDEGDLYKKEYKTPVPFSQDWLQQNDDPNKGFVLLLAYVNFDQGRSVFTNAFNAGHAVSLINAEPDMVLIDDPAHDQDEPGRKILTPEILTGGTFQLPGYAAPVSGLMLLSGDLMEAPPGAGVLLTGAVCITMHPPTMPSSVAGSPGVGAGNVTLGANAGVEPAAAPRATKPGAPPDSASSSWATWVFDFFFKK